MAVVKKPARWLGALAGIAAAAVAIGLAELIAALSGPQSAPVIAVGDVVVDSVPPSVKNFATSTFGTDDKNALITGTFILLAIVAAVIGAWAVHDIRIGYAGIALFGVLGAIAAVTRHGANAGAVFPSLIGAAAGAFVLFQILRGPRTRRPDIDSAAGRRTVLIGSVVALVGGLIAEVIGRQLGERRNVSSARESVVLPTPTQAPPSLAPDQALSGQTAFVTANSQFYRIDTALVVPQVDPNTWTLRVHGRVRKEITLTYQQLLARPMVQRYITLCCVSNPVGGNLISNALFQGVLLRDVLAEAGPLPGADQLVGRSVDGFTAGSPTAVVMDGRDALLAVGMNGEPLPVEHGFPVRTVVPGLYGYVSGTKWITELELTSFADFDAYWVPRGWSAMGPIKTESRIDTPTDGKTLGAGRVAIAGVAWAQHKGISKVEVRVDNDAWRPATLDPVPSVDTWRQWYLYWDATPGAHQLQVRATDNAGQTQTSQVADVAPNGASGYHTINVSVR
ncbi:MAG TPA: molybdopterin-dependent oxidoreductase [Micromonosporaceae bacterium]